MYRVSPKKGEVGSGTLYVCMYINRPALEDNEISVASPGDIRVVGSLLHVVRGKLVWTFIFVPEISSYQYSHEKDFRQNFAFWGDILPFLQLYGIFFLGNLWL